MRGTHTLTDHVHRGGDTTSLDNTRAIWWQANCKSIADTKTIVRLLSNWGLVLHAATCEVTTSTLTDKDMQCIPFQLILHACGISPSNRLVASYQIGHLVYVTHHHTVRSVLHQPDTIANTQPTSFGELVNCTTMSYLFV